MAKVRHSDKGLILFREDIEVSGARLPQILQGGNWELIECNHQASLGNIISDLERLPDLLILSLGCANLSMLEEIREVRAPVRNRHIPILGVVTFGKNGLDIPMLRAHGVVGLIDRDAEPEAVIHRVDSMVGSPECRRIYERVSCFLPVKIVEDRCLKNEFALDLSASGIRLTINKPIEPNTDLKLRFRLLMIDDHWINVNGRVVHRLPKRNSAGCYEVGVFFYPVSPFSQNLISKEVERLLAD